MKKFQSIVAAILFLAICGSGLMAQENTIQNGQVKQALNLAGLEFNDAEIDSMIPGLERNRNAFQSLRETSLENFTLPALIFNPIPPGFEFRDQNSSADFAELDLIELPRNMDELAYYSIPQLGCLLRNKKISSVELTRYFLDRLRKFDDTLHCVITYTEEMALALARQADEELANGIYRGPLHGIPYGAKDLLSVPGYKTTWGAEPYKEQLLDVEATVVRKLRESGAVLIAKLSMGALAWGDVWFGGKTRNPWNPETGSSGSSAGSASAVSAGLVPFAIGTETLGSIVSPSTVCGTTGLRPTFGRVSRYGAMALSWSMDKIGPICRSVEDCAIVFDAIRGSDERDPTTLEAGFNYNGDLDVKHLRIGYLKSVFESDYRFRESDSLALVFFRQNGIELIPVDLPDPPNIQFILSTEAAAMFDELTRTNRDELMVRQIRNAWPNVFRTARLVPAVEFLRAYQYRAKLIAEMDAIFRNIDLYLTPSWAGPSLGITNLTGHPQVVLPNGVMEDMPVSISFVGRLFGEAELLEFAKFYQERTDHHLARPPLTASR